MLVKTCSLDFLFYQSKSVHGWHLGLGKSPFMIVLGRQLREISLMTSQEPVYECWVTGGISQKRVKKQLPTDWAVVWGVGLWNNRLPVQLWLSLGKWLQVLLFLLLFSRSQECHPGAEDFQYFCCMVSSIPRLSWKQKKTDQGLTRKWLISDVFLSLEKQV